YGTIYCLSTAKTSRGYSGIGLSFNGTLLKTPFQIAGTVGCRIVQWPYRTVPRNRGLEPGVTVYPKYRWVVGIGGGGIINGLTVLHREGIHQAPCRFIKGFPVRTHYKRPASCVPSMGLVQGISFDHDRFGIAIRFVKP